MRHYLVDKDLFEAVSYDNQQTVIVAAYIENRVGLHIIRAAKKLPDMMEVPEFDMLDD